MPDIKNQKPAFGAYDKRDYCQRSKQKESVKILDPNNIPLRIYLGNGDQDTVRKVESAVLSLLELNGFEVTKEDKPQIGSWFKKCIARFKDEDTKEAMRERLEKIEQAFELAQIRQPKASINKDEAEAASILIESIKSEDEAVIQVGSLLILKRTNSTGKSQTLVRNLTDRELEAIEDFPDILKNPGTLFEEIGKIIAAGKQAQQFLIDQKASENTEFPNKIEDEIGNDYIKKLLEAKTKGKDITFRGHGIQFHISNNDDR